MDKRKKRTPKSGRNRTGTTSVKKRITWPHKVIYGADGHRATYKEFTVSSFNRGNLILFKDVQVSEVKDCMVLHLEELMEGTDIYDWEKVKAFHAAWLNLLEQCRCDWADNDQQSRALVSHTISGTKLTATSTGSGKKFGSSTMAYNAPTKPSTKTCEPFNANRCFKAHEHPEWQHICSFCLATTNRALPHPANSCNCKKAQVQEKIL